MKLYNIGLFHMLETFGEHLESHHTHPLHERLANLVGYQFFTSPTDIAIQSIVLGRGLNEATALIYPDQYPPDFFSLDPSVQKLIDMTCRSRAAQYGAVPLGFKDLETSQPVNRISQNSWAKLAAGERAEVPLLIYNYSTRLIQVGHGEPVPFFRIYTEVGAHHMYGNWLRVAIKNSQIAIDGEEGKDWKYLDGHPELGDAFGIALRILPERLWVPPDKKHPIVDFDLGPINRTGIDKLLKPIPRDLKHRYWIGETVPVLFENGIHAILGSTLTNGNYQTKSHVLDPGRDWNTIMGRNSGIRVEIQGRLDEDWIPVFFWQDQQ